MPDIKRPKATRAQAGTRHAPAPATDDAFHAVSNAAFAPSTQAPDLAGPEPAAAA